MIMESSTIPAVADAPQWKAALLGFVTMFSVGTVYALSTLQIEIPRLLEVSPQWSYTLFAAASLGLSIGVRICASCMAVYGEYSVAIGGTAIWGIAVASMGFFLATIPSLLGVIGSLLIGGIAVGLTYLATVVSVGQAFPNQPLARSAIGPLGFSSGTGSWLAVWSYLRVEARSARQVQDVLWTGGAVVICMAAAAYVLAPNQRSPSPISPRGSEKSSGRRFFLILLFCNALPGMAAFGSLLPITSFYTQKTTGEALDILPRLMVALALGGLFASTISSRLGARLTFVMLFCARGLLLVITSLSPTLPIATVTLLVVFFAHGAGFSLIPGLVKAQQRRSTLFPREYGEVLTAWGVAGILGNLINAAFVPPSGDATFVSFLLGLASLTFGIILSSISLAHWVHSLDVNPPRRLESHLRQQEFEGCPT
ncbi:major facilitator superfamily domain-containing protein [Xylaria flabelliformis]|nr:major facilitator superfamily domain-containing protein [Xylaria flabelliformis]